SLAEVALGDARRVLGDPGRQQRVCEWLQPGIPSDGGLSLAALLIWQVEVLEAGLRLHGADLAGELFGEVALLLDGLEHGLLALRQLAQVVEAGCQLAGLGIIHPAGDLFAVPGDEGNRVALVEQGDAGLDVRQSGTYFLG